MPPAVTSTLLFVFAAVLASAGCEGGAAVPSDGGVGSEGGSPPDASPYVCHPPRQLEGPWQYVRPDVPGALGSLVGPPDYLTLDGAGPLLRLLWSPDDGKRWCQISTPLPPVQILRRAEGPAAMLLAGVDDATKQARLFRTSDFGESWTPLDQTFSGRPDGLFELQKPRPMLVATFSDRYAPATMMVSTDDGRTFVPRTVTVSGAPQERPAGWRSIRPDPLDPEGLLAVVAFLRQDPYLPPGELAQFPALIASRDGGETWQALEVPDANPVQNLLILDDGRLIAVGQDGAISIREPGAGNWRRTGSLPTPMQGTTLFAGYRERDTFYLTGYTTSGAFRRLALRTNDAGATWSTLVEAVYNEGILPVQPGHLVGVSDIGLRISRDDGRSWTQSFHTPGRQIQVTAGSGDASRIYSVTYGSVLRSDDGGRTWSGGFLESHTLDEIAPDPGNRDVLYGLLRPLTGGGLGVHRSDDAGTRWTAIEVGEATAAGAIYSALPVGTSPAALLVTTGAGTFRSEDDGATFQLVSRDVSGLLRASPSAPATVVAAGQWVSGSEDGGKTWTERAGGAGPFQAVEFHPTNPDRLYVLGAYGFSTVSLSRPEPPRATLIPAAPSRTGRLIAGTASGHVYVIDRFNRLWHSPDEGMTWDKPQGGSGSLSREGGPDGIHFLSVVTDPARPDSILVSTDSGLLRTTTE